MTTVRHLAALVDPAADAVLVMPDDPPRLPVVAAEWPKPADLRAAVGSPTAWPAGPTVAAGGGLAVDVLVARAPEPAHGRRWWPLAHVQALALGPAGSAAVVGAARELREGAPDDGRAPWWVPAWADEADAWVDLVLARRGLGERRLGPGEPVKVWTLAAVVRYLVADATGRQRSMWFKQPAAAFAAEPAITAWVARAAPYLAPDLVGLDATRGRLLLEHVTAVDEQVDPALLVDVARHHAHAQIGVLPSLDGLVQAGAPDRGAATTVAGLRRVVPASKALPGLVDAVVELYAAGLPVTVVHGDLHLFNIGRRFDGRPVVFDWTDACLAHPYLDGRHLATSAERTLGAAAAAQVRDAYLAVWAAAYPGVDHARLWELARRVDLAFTLLSYDAIGRALRPQDRAEHAPVMAQLVAEIEATAGLTPP